MFICFTEFVADTSDTSTDTWISSSDSGDLSLHVEYEVASLSEGPNPFDDSSSSGGPVCILYIGAEGKKIDWRSKNLNNIFCTRK